MSKIVVMAIIKLSDPGHSGVKEIMNNSVISFNQSVVETLLVLMTKISGNFRHKIAIVFVRLAGAVAIMADSGPL